MEGSKKIKKNYNLIGTESDPVIIAQRLLNLYRQLHIFSAEKKEAYNKMLLEQPSEVRKSLGNLPGGIVVQQYLDDLEESNETTDPQNDGEDSFTAQQDAIHYAEDNVTPSATGTHPTVVSVASDPAMIKGIVDAFKDALITSEKNRKEDTKELVQTMIALQSRLMEAKNDNLRQEQNTQPSTPQSTQMQTPVQSVPVISSADPEMIKQIADAIKDALITSEKSRKEDTKELVQTIIALQSRLMQAKEAQSTPKQMPIQTEPVSTANDPEMIKGIVDAFKEALVTSEKNRKEDTKELAQTIVALQSRLMKNMMEKMPAPVQSPVPPQTTTAMETKAATVETTKVTTVETRVLANEASNTIQAAQLEDIVAGISRAQSQLIKEIAHTQTEQLSVLISKVLKEIQQMSTKTLADAVQTVHRENMDFFKNQIFSSVSMVPIKHKETDTAPDYRYEEYRNKPVSKNKYSSKTEIVEDTPLPEEETLVEEETAPEEIFESEPEIAENSPDEQINNDFNWKFIEEKEPEKVEEIKEFITDENLLSENKEKTERKEEKESALDNLLDEVLSESFLATRQKEEPPVLPEIETPEENLSAPSDIVVEDDKTEEITEPEPEILPEEPYVTEEKVEDISSELSKSAGDSVQNNPLIDYTPVSLNLDDITPIDLDAPAGEMFEPEPEPAPEEEEEWEYVEEEDDGEWEYVEEEEASADDDGEWEYVEESEDASPSDEEYDWEYVEEDEAVEENVSATSEEDDGEWEYVEEEDDETFPTEDDGEWEYVEEEVAEQEASGSDVEDVENSQASSADEEYDWEYVEEDADTDIAATADDDGEWEYVEVEEGDDNFEQELPTDENNASDNLQTQRDEDVQEEPDPYRPEQAEEEEHIDNPLFADNSFVFNEEKNEEENILLDDDFGLASNDDVDVQS